MPEDGIRFCRWLDAFPDGRVFDNKFAEKDRDKFRIKIPGIVPNLTKAKIKSTEIHGAMIGGAFVNKTTDGDYEIQMNAENGVTHSTPILLVSDGDDDKTYNGNGRDDKDNDQTLLADFNSKIIVTFPELNSTQVEFKASKPKGEIKVNVLYLSLDGTIPKDKRETLELHLRKAREIYRQYAIKFTVTNISPYRLPPVWADYLAESRNSNNVIVEKDKYLNPMECQKLINEMRNQAIHPVPKGQILITFIDAVLEPEFGGGTARGFCSGVAQPLDPPAIISLFSVRRINEGISNAEHHLTTAHEIGHILGLDHPGVITHLLMTGVGTFRGSVYKYKYQDSKRIKVEDFNIIKERKPYYVQLK